MNQDTNPDIIPHPAIQFVGINRRPQGPRAYYLPYASEVYGPRAGPPISEIIKDGNYGCYDESYCDNDEPDACGPEQESFDNINGDVEEKQRERKNLLMNAVINPTLNVNTIRRIPPGFIPPEPFLFYRGVSGRAGPRTFIPSGNGPYGTGTLIEEDGGIYGPARGPVMRR
jgi:hypothetical protein